MQRRGVYIGDNLQEIAGQTGLAKKRLVTNVRSQNWHVQAFLRLSQLARSQSMVSCACLGPTSQSGSERENFTSFIQDMRGPSCMFVKGVVGYSLDTRRYRIYTLGE